MLRNLDYFLSQAVEEALEENKQSPDWCGSVGWAFLAKCCHSIPGEGTCLGCRPGPKLRVYKKQPTDVSSIDVTLYFSLPSPISKNK